MHLGVSETKDIVLSAGELCMGIDAAGADGEYSAMDITHFMGFLASLPAAITGADMVMAEIADLDDAEKQELYDVFKNKFDIEDDLVEEGIERSLETALSLVANINYWRRVREVKAAG